AEKGAVEVEGHHVAPSGEVGVLDAAEHGDAGGVDEAIEPAGGTIDVVDDTAPILFRGDVERVIHPGRPGEVGSDRKPARLHDRFGDGRADGAGGTGDEDDFVFKAAHTSDQ